MYKQAVATLKIRQVDGELLILDTQANRIHQLNETATLIWQLSGTASSVEEIAGSMADTFEVDADIALGDVRRALDEFCAAGLLSGPDDVIVDSTRSMRSLP
jgi:hypothetical protein